MGLAFWKENIKNRVKLLEPNVLNNCCLKITSANLRKIGLKMREWENLGPKFPSEGGSTNPSPQKSTPLALVVQKSLSSG